MTSEGLGVHPAAQEHRTSIVRLSLLIPAVVLFLAGLAVTFTQAYHDVLPLNRTIFGVFGILFGLSLLTRDSETDAKPTHRPGRLLLAAVSVALGVVGLFMHTTALLSLVLIVWASLVTVIQAWRWAVTRNRDAIVTCVFAVVLTLILAFAARELPAVMGFFAAFCIIVAVYVGISSFDRAEPQTSASATHSQTPTENGS